MKRLLLFVVTVLCVVISQAQLLTWTPPFPKENDPSQTLEITVDATKGNQGLLNFSGDVYVHIGVITNKSANGDDWKYVPFQWATSPANGKAASLGNNKWKYTIAGSLRTFFGITDATETIQKIAILFRNADGTRAPDRTTPRTEIYTHSRNPKLVGWYSLYHLGRCQPGFDTEALSQRDSCWHRCQRNVHHGSFHCYAYG